MPVRFPIRWQLRRLCTGVAAAACAAALCTAAWVLTPPDADVMAPPEALGLTLADRYGVPLRNTRAPGGERWRWVPLADMDPVVASAFIAAEDRRFLDHRGVAWSAVARAARDNLLAGRVVSGASTITMQLARLLRGHDRGLLGKVQQVAWAVRLEQHYSKSALLEQYLNRVPLGQGAVGVEAAARLYFGTSSARLGPGRAALLAGIARSPARNNPFSAPERAAERRGDVLQSLERAGYLTSSERTLAENEPVRAAMLPGAVFRAPHFTTRVLASLDSGEQLLRDAPGGAPIRTTLDYALQLDVERDVRQVVQSLTEQHVRQAAVVVLDNANGDVLAWVGSPDFYAARGQVDMVTSRRQPGSALKPFLYALAFERGYGASSILDDIPRTWMTSTGAYRPRNYDRQFRGPVRARVALGSSLNLPAVQLADALGASALLGVLHRAGFASLMRSADHYGLGLALGNGEVTLLELANGFRALANGGTHAPVRRLLADSSRPAATRVVRADVAALTLDILTDADARLSGFGEAAVFDFPFPVAVKTGTSRHFTDNWAVGATGGFTVAVWVGNFDGTPMSAVSGVAGAGPLLRRVVLATAQRLAPGLLASPASFGAVRERVCRTSGLAATTACDGVDEWRLAGTAPLAPDDWHRDGAVVLPSRFAEWERAQVRRTLASSTAPSAVSASSTPLEVLSPKDGDVFVLPVGPARSVATVALRASRAHAAESLTWTVDGQPHAASRWLLAPGTHLVRVTAASGAQAEARVIVRVVEPASLP